MKSLDALLDASPEIAEKKSAKQQPSAAKKKLATKTPLKAAAKTPMKTPKSAKTAMKTPKSAKTPPASTRRATRNTPAVKMTPLSAKKAPKSTKKAPKSTKKVSATPKLQNLADVKEISIRLKALDNSIMENPKVLLSQVESLPATPERVDQVIINVIRSIVTL